MSISLGHLPLPASSNKEGGGGRYFINPSGNMVSTISFYIVVSITATFINKLLYTTSEYKFPYPFFTAFFQLATTFTLLTLWSVFRPIRRSYARIPAFKWDSTVAIRVAPLTIVYMCVIIFNPLFLQYVEVSTYHFAHSLSIAFSILFSYLMLQVETSQKIVSACIIIIFGMCINSMGYLNFSLVGGFYSLAWPAIIALYGIYMKKTLTALRNDYWSVIQYNTLMSAIILIPLVLLSGELHEIFKNVYFWDEFGFWLQMIITALTGFSVNAAMLLMLLYTSPLTATVASTAKTAIQTFVVAILFGNLMTSLNKIGMMIAVVGSCYYAYLRSDELKL